MSFTVMVNTAINRKQLAHVSPDGARKTLCKLDHNQTKRKNIKSLDGVTFCTICVNKIEKWPEKLRQAYQSTAKKAG